PLLVAALPLRPAGTAMNDSLGRRPGATSPVGPDVPRTKCAPGGSYGELRIGLSSSMASVMCGCVLPLGRVSVVRSRHVDGDAIEVVEGGPVGEPALDLGVHL